MRRVVVTGIGAVTPVGNNVPEFWEAIKNGKTVSHPSPDLMSAKANISWRQR